MKDNFISYVDKILSFKTSYHIRKYGLITNVNFIKSGESGPP